jgi:rRNA processing protein Krr1/Pno1
MKNNEVVEAAPAANVSSAIITVPEPRIGVVIGPKGANIKLIQEKTKVTRIDTAGNVFTITGSSSAVAEAEVAIKELIDKGFTQLQYDDFAENFVNVHPSYFPDLIGSKGCIIQKMKSELKVEVNMPQVPTGAPGGKKFKVVLAGAAKQVEEAKNVINSIMMYGHHEVTHPGMVHEELDVEKWQYSFIIGKGGSELKHIQKNWDVKMSIPREHSVNQKVLIVGEPSNVSRAKVYVEKVLWNSENQVRSGRDRAEGGDDGWGDEEDEEPWMRDYIYKRR